MRTAVSLLAVTTLSKQQWLVNESSNTGMLVTTNRLSRETIDSRKALRDAVIIQDGIGLYILLIN